MSTTKPIEMLTIKGFKSIKNLENFRLNNLNVLIGANGAGKSNFVAYFKMLNELVEGRIQNWTTKQGTADRILSFGVKKTDSLKSYVRFGINGYLFVLEPTDEGAFSFAQEKIYFNGPIFGKKWIDLGSGHKEALLKEKFEEWNKGSEADYCYSSISSWNIYHFHDTGSTAGMKRVGALHDNKFLRSDASNLAAFLYRHKDESLDVYKKICKTISLAIPLFDDFVLEPTTLPSEEKQIRLLWKQKDSDYELWPSQRSDGSIRFICLVTALLQPVPPSTIIIDEPELGLHPYAITLLGGLLRSASTRMQVIVSTQSVPLVNEFEIEDLIVVEREDGATVFKRHEEEEFSSWLEDYSVGELWEKNILGGRPKK